MPCMALSGAVRPRPGSPPRSGRVRVAQGRVTLHMLPTQESGRPRDKYPRNLWTTRVRSREGAGERSARTRASARIQGCWLRGSSAIARPLIYRSDEVAGRRGVHMHPPGQPPAQSRPADAEWPEKLHLPRSSGLLPTSPTPDRGRSARSWPGSTPAPGARIADQDFPLRERGRRRWLDVLARLSRPTEAPGEKLPVCKR